MQKQHALFTSKNFYLKKISGIELGSRLRTEVAHMFLQCKFMSIHNQCKQIQKMQIDENILIDAVNAIVQNYEHDFMEELKIAYPSVAYEVYRIFYENNFKPMHEANVDFLHNFIHMQSKSSYPFEFIMDTFFTLTLTAFDLATYDVERSFRNINGQFSSIETKVYKKMTYIFISYAHEDEKYKEELLKHIHPFILKGEITIWEDSQLRAGEKWENRIYDAIDSCNIFIALLSSDYLASDFCNIEFQRASIHGKSVVPILARPCAAHLLDVSEFQFLPRGAKPISTFQDKDEAYLQIVTELKKIL